MGPMPRLLSEITSNGEAAFPWKLHRVLEESERCGFSDIVSWQGNRAFKVHDPKNFEKSIMKKYFNQTRYKSFQRQLNIYGFERITIGTDIGSYTHHLLVRGKPNICRFMVRTKVKNKGSKAAANSHSPAGASRRSSSAGVRQGMVSSNIQPLSKMSRSMSCPDATTSRNIKRSIISDASNGLNNELFTLDQCSKPESSHRDLSTRTMPSTIENEFSDDLFSNDPFDVNFSSSGAQNSGSNSNGIYVSVSVDGMSEMNSRSRRRNDLPSLLLCEDNIQDDITALGNSSRSNNSQASDVAFQQQTELDPFQPQPISEQHMHQQHQQHHMHQQQQQQQQIIEQQMQQQQQLVREQECRMLQLQIQELQNQIVSMNQQQPQQQQRMNCNAPNNSNNNNNHSNYLCNGVAAIEPSDRGMVTPTLSPSDSMVLKNNRLLEQLAEDPEELMLDPTPIFTPAMSVDNNTNMNTNNHKNPPFSMGGNVADANMTMMMSRSISFGSFPQNMISGNVM